MWLTRDLLCEYCDSISVNLIQEERVEGRPRTNYVNTTTQQVLKIVLECYHFQGFGRHIYEKVDIATLAILSTRNRTEHTQRLNPILRAKSLGSLCEYIDALR